MAIDWASTVKPKAQEPSGGIDWKATVKGAARGIDWSKTVDKVTKGIGGAIQYGHEHPWEATMNVLGAPQRGLQALELGAGELVHPTKANAAPELLSKIGHAIVTPKTGEQMRGQIEKNVGLAGPGLPKAVGRTALDIANDPLNFAPVGKLGALAKKIPGVAKGAEIAGKAIGDTAGRLLNPDEYMRGLTPDAKATYELITNRAMQATRRRKEIEDAIVVKHADEIRAGKMPEEVIRLFQLDETGRALEHPRENWQKYFRDPETGAVKFGAGTRPQDVQAALYAHRAPMFKTLAMDSLRQQGFFSKPSEYISGRGPFAVKDTVALDDKQHAIQNIQRRLEQNLEHKIAPIRNQDVLTRAAQVLTHRGNQAFLANPVPHTLNLSNLAYNKYGLPTVARGIGNAVQVATGKLDPALAKQIEELKTLGAHSQYANIFDELGLTKIANLPNTEALATLANKLLIPGQRLSNYAQHKILNAMETGLRAAALEAERKGGVTGADAAKSIHATFGTNAPNLLTQGARGIGAPFAQFHLQTAPGSFLKTLGLNPARIANVQKAQRDLNQPGQPQYRSSVPALSGSRATADPLAYWFSSLGPLVQLGSPYGPIEQLKKGKVKEAVGEEAGRFIPASAELGALIEAARGKRGRAGESALQDLAAAIVGGYYQKAKP